MQLPQSLARFNRRVTNPVQRLWAGWAPSFAIVEHTGRTSGKPYRTPVTAFATEDGVAVLLSYGPDRDWLKNLRAAGGGRVVRGGRPRAVTDPRVVSRDDAAALVRSRTFARLPFDQAVLLIYA
ncbi:nitroreductase family deazaflavin-dependent oxidoreductase [Tsukamurella tyrosinosolvens]|uniref:nitroreductase family deazaflavin-dependent oxidoreductase n=1 Tax=Tsukamurella tyrosinosolvens TaxID=57704 RepID=UPI000C7EFF89|nr:nitroreductase family deazaflavin-dependent oxidoreductase [Tsukamurella tyrosinosolvens]AUN40198.1 nitroreductase family deazaflavin-dependent oxidoreductase [Tsukamurella tyrosinosolvens]